MEEGKGILTPPSKEWKSRKEEVERRRTTQDHQPVSKLNENKGHDKCGRDPIFEE